MKYIYNNIEYELEKYMQDVENIYVGRHKSKNIIVKKIHSSHFRQEEIDVLKKLNNIDNDNFIKMLNYSFNKKINTHFICFPLYDNVIDLYDYIDIEYDKHCKLKNDIDNEHYKFKSVLRQYKSFNTDRLHNVKTIMIDIFNIIDYLTYKENIVHCDLKDDNFLININTLKITLIDFQSSIILNINAEDDFDTQFYNYMNNNPIITPEYMPIEFFKKTNFSICRLQTWSLGCLFYNIVYFKIPFDYTNEHDMIKYISKGELNVNLEYTSENTFLYDLLYSNLTWDNVLNHKYLKYI